MANLRSDAFTFAESFMVWLVKGGFNLDINRRDFASSILIYVRSNSPRQRYDNKGFEAFKIVFLIILLLILYCSVLRLHVSPIHNLNKNENPNILGAG